jgi:hypothetical protein
MLTIVITVSLMAAAGTVVWLAFRYWSGLQFPPRLNREGIRTEVRRHPRLAVGLTARMDPSAITGLALTTAASANRSCHGRWPGSSSTSI